MTTTGLGPGIPGEVFDLLDRLDVRYEVIDGQLVVSPSATFGHERLSSIVRAHLVIQCPDGMDVLGPDFNVYYAWPEPWFVCPDALVARTDDADDDGIRVAPLLVLETLSRSSRRGDTGAKWDIYAERGIPVVLADRPQGTPAQCLRAARRRLRRDGCGRGGRRAGGRAAVPGADQPGEAQARWLTDSEGVDHLAADKPVVTARSPRSIASADGRTQPVIGRATDGAVRGRRGSLRGPA